MTTTFSSSYGRSRESIGDIEEQLHSVFAQNPHVYYKDDSDVPYVPADELVNIIPAFSEAYGVELMSEDEFAHLKSITAQNPGLDVNPQILTHLIAERAPKKSDSPERPPSRPPSRGPQTPGTGKGPSPFDRRQRSTPLGGEAHAPSSWAKRPPPSRRKSDAGSRSDSESYTSPPTAYGRSRAPSNPTSPAMHYASLASPTFSQTPSRPHSRQSLRMVGSPELDESTMMRPLALFGSDSDPDSDEEVAMGLIPDRVAGASTISLLEQADHETLQRENGELKKKLLEAESTLQNRLIEHDNELEELQAKLDELRSELNAAKREEKELRSKERQNMTQITMLESEIAKVSDALRIAKETYTSLQRQYQEQCSASERYRDDLRKRDETIRSLREAVGLHEHEATKWTREQQHYEDRLTQLDSELALANQLQAELDAQKQENLTLKETIDRLHFELDEQRNTTVQGANVAHGGNSAPGTLSKSLGAELAKNGWGEDEKEEEHVSQASIDVGNMSFDLDDESPEEEDFIETIVTRRRRVPTRTNKNEPLSFEEVREYSDAFTQYESSEFCTSITTQTDPEPIVPTVSSSIQTEAPSSVSFAIQTEPQPEPIPKVTFDIDIQTDDLEEFVSLAIQPEEPIASTSSSSSASDSTETPSTPKARAKQLDELVLHDQPPAYTQVPQDDGEVLKKWHPNLSSPEDLTLPGPISEEAVEEWKALKEELGIDCLVIDKLLASAPRAPPPPTQTPSEGKQIRRGRFYNIYNTYIYGKSQSSSPSPSSNIYTVFGVGLAAFAAGYWLNFYPQTEYITPGQLGYYDRHLWRTVNSMSPAGEGFTSDTTSAVWSILGRVGGGAARIARGWPT